MKILIVDNEALLRQSLSKMIQLSHFAPVQIEEAGGVADGVNAVKKFQPDILFLDIEMEDGTGFELLQQLEGYSFQLIFTTAFNQYAIKAFRFCAIDYLLKPINPLELDESLKRAIEQLQRINGRAQIDLLLDQMNKVTHKKIVLKDIDATYFVQLPDIIYCQAEGTYTKFFIESASPITISKNLKEFEYLLEEEGFIRTHHSFLVNKMKVKKFEKKEGGQLLLSGGYIVPVSLRKKDYVLKCLGM